MKYYLSSLIMLFLLIIGIKNSFAQLEISKLTENCYVYTTYKDLGGYNFGSNSMFIVTDSGIVLLDTPWDSTQFQPLLDSLDFRFHKKILMCISTHYHDDRTAGLEYFAQKGIKTYSSYFTLQLCEKNGEKKADNFFINDTTFIFGKTRIETFYPGGGHTRDNIVVWIENEKVLYAACFIKSIESRNLGNLKDSDLMHWENSLQNLIKKYPNPTYVVPGHQAFTSTENIQHTLKLLKAQR